MENFVIKEGIHFIGKPCNTCGNTIRYVKGRQRCVKCIKKASRRHYQHNRDVLLEQNKQWRIKTEYDKRRYRDNTEREKRRNKQYYDDNTNTVLKRNKQWKQNNPEKINTLSINRRALKQNAEGSFTDQEWIDLCNFYGNVCLCCKEQKPLERDHIVLLSKGGTNWITNIQPLCGKCNGEKYTKTIDYRETFNTKEQTT